MTAPPDPAATIASLRATADAIKSDHGIPEFPELVQELTEAAALIEAMAARIDTLQQRALSSGWLWYHDHEAALIARDGLMCETHPGLQFRHDPACPGPGMAWKIEGRESIDALYSRISVLERDDSAELLAAEQQAVANCDEVLALRAKVAALEAREQLGVTWAIEQENSKLRDKIAALEREAEGRRQ